MRISLLTFLFFTSTQLGSIAQDETEARRKFATVAGNIEAAVGKFYDSYTSIENRGQKKFWVGSAVREKWAADGVIRICIFPPDGATRTFDVTEELRDASITSIRLISHKAEMTYVRDGSQIVASASMHLHPGRPIAYQIIRRAK
jgi:hypothetical protein